MFTALTSLGLFPEEGWRLESLRVSGILEQFLFSLVSNGVVSDRCEAISYKEKYKGKCEHLFHL